MQRILNNPYFAFLKLVRIENLLMIAFTQYVLRYFVLRKILVQNGSALEMDHLLFFLVVLSTVLIAAGGYIINDYFDVKTDLINHPDTVVVDRVIKRRWAIILHLTLTSIGLLLGVFVALKTGYLRLFVFQLTAAMLLWFYSTDFKKKLLLGNILVALLSATVAFMPFVYEMALMQKHDSSFMVDSQRMILSAMKITVLFCVFAFITSLAREIIKDIEDYKGDKATGGLTMPVLWGIRTSKFNAFFLMIITVILLLFVVYNTIKTYRIVFNFNNGYILVFLILPLLFLSVYVLRANESKAFTRASLVLKFVMLMGLCYSFVFYYS